MAPLPNNQTKMNGTMPFVALRTWQRRQLLISADVRNNHSQSAEAGGILSLMHRGAVFIADVRLLPACSSFFGQC